MNAEASTASSGGANAGLIAFDLSCTSCGYNLRGLREGGVCPECANPIDRSLRGDLLIYADPTWLRRLHLGTRLMLWCIVIGLVAGLLTGAASVMGLPLVVMMLPMFAVGVFNVWSVYCLTTQEPRTAGHEEPITLRNVIRAAALVGLGCGLVNILLMQIGGLVALEVSSAFSNAVGVVTVLGICAYLRRFALRMPDESLARSTRIVAWGQAASLACMALLGFAALFGFSAMGPTGPTATSGPAVPSMVAMGVMGVLGCAGGVAGLVFAIWYIVLLLRYRDAFKVAAGQSAGDLAARRGEVSAGG